MKLLIAAEQTQWWRMYCYWAGIFEDCLEIGKMIGLHGKELEENIISYLREVEHQGQEPRCHEIDTDYVDDVPTWYKKRKELLKEDWETYLETL